jgi:hypothetical protein
MAFAPARRYLLFMVAKLSPRAAELLAAAVELDTDERRAIADGLQSAPVRAPAIPEGDRHAELVRRVESVRRGDAVTLSLAEVERSLRDEIDF